MTTKHSPIRSLRNQAEQIAAMLKREVGRPHEKPETNFAVIMDDNVLKITMAWSTISETSEAGLVEFILKHMRERRDQ